MQPQIEIVLAPLNGSIARLLIPWFLVAPYKYDAGLVHSVPRNRDCLSGELAPQCAYDQAMSSHEHQNEHHHHHGHAHLDEAHWVAYAAQTELEGDVLIEFVHNTADRLAELHPEPIRRIIDVGSGPGVASCALAQRFPNSTVLAVDSSPVMLERATQRAARLGMQDRIQTLVAELPHGLEKVEPADLIWASMSLHHVGDEVAALRTLRSLLAPSGVIAIAEFADPTQSLPTDIGFGEPGLADRLLDAQRTWFVSMRAGLPNSVDSMDLVTMIERAGLKVVDQQIVRVRIDAPLPTNAREWLVGNYQRAFDQFGPTMSPADNATLAVLLDASDTHSLMQRNDVFVEASRRIVFAN
jgi:SAM-dependent methyltransferase